MGCSYDGLARPAHVRVHDGARIDCQYEEEQIYSFQVSDPAASGPDYQGFLMGAVRGMR